MPSRKMNSLTTKLAIFSVVTATVVFCTQSQMATNDVQDTQQIQRRQVPIAAVPVDRNSLSQEILPALTSINPLSAGEGSSSSIIAPETEPRSESQPEPHQLVSKSGPSDYQLRLDDQKAWGSQPRPASLVAKAKLTSASPEKMDVAISQSPTQSPIVPGHEDPHLWYQSQFPELAMSIDNQQNQHTAAIAPNNPIEFSQLPDLTSEVVVSADLQAKSISEETASVKTLPLMTEQVTANRATANPLPAPVARMARAWETGRY